MFGVAVSRLHGLNNKVLESNARLGICVCACVGIILFFHVCFLWGDLYIIIEFADAVFDANAV